MTSIQPCHALYLSILLLLSSAAIAQDETAAESYDAEKDVQEEVLVWGRAIDLVGAADSASEGIVGFDDLKTRPLLRVGELVEVIPGMIATQHSGGGKANQYFLRGINLDHGTDFSIQFEGMPVNFRSHAHGQGYLDMNFIIPELVQSIEYRKGTYSADVGDFSAASSSKFKTYDTLNQGFAELIYGTEEYFRAVAANSWAIGSGDLLLGAEVRRSDGPWENPENVQLFNGFAKYTRQIGDYSLSVIGTAYSNEWNATDQIPRRAVESGDLSRFGFVDPSVGGKTRRFNLITSLTNGTTDWQAFVSNYELNLFGNPTYYLNDPINGDQIEQEDRRWVFGGRVDHETAFSRFTRPLTLRLGADTRYDKISEVNLYNTSLRQRVSTVRNDSVNELSLGTYAELAVAWTDKLRTTLGVRGDFFSWDVSAIRTENSGSGSDAIVAPKISIAYNINDEWEIYANYGGGFHSNDVRAAETRVDPVTGDPAETFKVISEATGFETGFRAEVSDTLNFSATFFSLKLDSELIFVGDAGATEPNDATERIGVEATIFWQATDWLVLDATAAKTDAKFVDAAPGLDQIPDAHDIVGAAGATFALGNGLVSSIRLRYFGDAPLNEDGSATKSATTLVNFGISYPIGDFLLGLDVLNVFDEEGNDIEYYYESRLENEPLPIEDYHFHPVEPREFRLKLQYQF